MSHKSLEILVNASFLRGMKCVGWVIMLRFLAKTPELSGKLLFIEGIALLLKDYL
jgi:hypothetical protein